MRTGVRFVQNSPEMQTVLIRTFFFIFFISGLWALLPVIVRQDLRLGAPGYGLLLGCIGVGAVVGAAMLPQIQRKIPVVDRQVIISTVAMALVMIAFSYLRNLYILCLIATIGGIAWIMLVSSFNVAAQEASPTWVRARARKKRIFFAVVAVVVGTSVLAFGLDYAVNPQIALDRRRGADQISLVREAHVKRRRVRFRVDSDRRDVHLAARAHDAHGNLAAVGNKNFLEHESESDG